MTLEELIEKHKLNPAYASGIGDGWVPLVDKLLTQLQESGWEGKVEQVKEKFGALRIYVSGATGEQYNLICDTEDESLKICESCGSREGVTTEGRFWIKTLCPECRK